MKNIEIGSISMPYSLPKETMRFVWEHDCIPLEEHRNCNTTMTDQEIITVVTARMSGKRIEKRCKFHGEQPWVLDDLERWNFLEYDYRVASEPRRVWLKGGFHEGKIRWIECEKGEPGAVQFVEVKP